MDEDFVVLRPSPERDPDGSRMQEALRVHFACEAALGARRLFVSGMAWASVAVWPVAIWPGALPARVEGVALAVWPGLFLGALVAFAAEWHWRTIRARLALELGPPSEEP